MTAFARQRNMESDNIRGGKYFVQGMPTTAGLSGFALLLARRVVEKDFHAQGQGFTGDAFSNVADADNADGAALQ